MLQEKSNKQSHFGRKKCILMLILLEINAFIKKKNPTFLPCQVGNTFFIKHISKVGCGHRFFFFFWHGHFSNLLDSRRADICRVAGGKAEIKADFHLIFPKYNCIIK